MREALALSAPFLPPMKVPLSSQYASKLVSLGFI